MLCLGRQAVGAGQIASTHPALHVVSQLPQRQGLGVGLGHVGLQAGQLPGRLAELAGQTQARHLLGSLRLCCGGVRSAGTGRPLARQPERHGEGDLGFAPAGVAVEAVVAVAQLQRRRCGPEPGGAGAFHVGTAALAVGLTRSDGALPRGVEGGAQGHNSA